MAPHLNVVLPIETLHRELDCRLLLAGLFGTPRHRFFVCSCATSYRLVEHLRGGLYVGKHLMAPVSRGSKSLVYHVAKDHGFAVVHLSEEGAVFLGNEEDWKSDLALQLDPRILEPEDFICTWGDFQRDFYLSYSPRCASNVRTTGHPRFDIYKARLRSYFDAETRKLRARLGPYVLVTTSFGYVAAPEGFAHTFVDPWFAYDPVDLENRSRHVGRWARYARLLPDYVEFVHQLSVRRPDLTVLVRPHPSEDHAFYETVFRDVPNIRVERTGAVTPWIAASRVLVHDSSTTALEAHMLGRPIVNFSANRDPNNQLAIVGLLGRRCHALDEALDATLGALSSESGPTADHPEQPLPEAARSLFYDGDSFARFVDVLREAESRLVPMETDLSAVASLIGAEARAWAIEGAKSLVRPFSPHRQRAVTHSRALFSGFDEAYIRSKLDVVHQLTGTRLEMTYYGKTLFELRPV